jgi:hypothetical protein
MRFHLFTLNRIKNRKVLKTGFNNQINSRIHFSFKFIITRNEMKIINELKESSFSYKFFLFQTIITEISREWKELFASFLPNICAT